MKKLRLFRPFTLLLLISFSITPSRVPSQQTVKPRAIISDDFTKSRPTSKTRRKSGSRNSRTYRPPSATQEVSLNGKLQLGLTLWKLKPSRNTRYGSAQHIREQWEAQRVEADTPFREGDLLRLSIESPRDGYLYVINRDWFADTGSGETNLIFPKRGEDNRLRAGRLIDIPAENQLPFRANPKPNQAGEFLTIIVSSAPIPLPFYEETLPISNAQLTEWEERWGGLTERHEMVGGAGQARTVKERQAAAIKGARQLTRDDPSPQTIFLLTPKNNDGLLFNLMLFYAR